MAKSWHFRFHEDIPAPPTQVFAWFAHPEQLEDLRDRPVRGSVIDREWQVQQDGDVATINASWMQGDGTRIELRVAVCVDAAHLIRKTEAAEVRSYVSGNQSSVLTDSVYEFRDNGDNGTTVLLSTVLTLSPGPFTNPLVRPRLHRQQAPVFHDAIRRCRAALSAQAAERTD